jgi:hypothetical protein
VPQIAFKPNRTRLAKAALFRRNGDLPVGVIAFPNNGIPVRKGQGGGG